MGKALVSVEEVKNALNIESFRNLSKDKVMEFVSLIPNMDKDLAIKIVEQFPSYADYSQNIVKQLNMLCEKALELNDNSQTEAIEVYKKVLDELSVLLQKEETSVDERKYITEKMIEVADKIAIKDTENKEFLEKIIKYGGYVALGALAIGVTILGVNVRGKDIPKLK
ncbi:hypothetical protein K2F51_09455 [Streptococcus mutans OMZ175]|uniref:hypothetical protein n=1 Tax=Streptococcus mutans TaxID=1309 RepID=UPI0002B5409D|nr:hypothetical protein [Streptococcus mutans]EMC60287.1 hypothetical protein SMU109_01873 [Streptococcus mutans OMZ175]QZS44096.1 hypothetical protein K2F51_09455 [Streptococcus mutans OMZ175]